MRNIQMFYSEWPRTLVQLNLVAAGTLLIHTVKIHS